MTNSATARNSGNHKSFLVVVVVVVVVVVLVVVVVVVVDVIILAQLAELIVQLVKSCLCVTGGMSVNQGGTNHSRYS